MPPTARRSWCSTIRAARCASPSARLTAVAAGLPLSAGLNHGALQLAGRKGGEGMTGDGIAVAAAVAEFAPAARAARLARVPRRARRSGARAGGRARAGGHLQRSGPAHARALQARRQSAGAPQPALHRRGCRASPWRWSAGGVALRISHGSQQPLRRRDAGEVPLLARAGAEGQLLMAKTRRRSAATRSSASSAAARWASSTRPRIRTSTAWSR